MSLVGEETDIDFIDSLMAKLKLDTGLSDASSMMDDLVIKIYRLLAKHGMQQFVERADPKRIVKWIVQALEPHRFRIRIEKKLELQMNAHLKKDPVRAANWIAQDLRYFLEYAGAEIRKSKSEVEKVEKKSWPKKRMNEGESKGESKVFERKRPDYSREFKREQQRYDCLKCGSRDHVVKRCPKTQPGEAERLLEANRKKREQYKPEVQQIAARGTEETGLVPVKLEDCYDTNALLDSGADCAMMSAGLVNKLVDLKKFIKMNFLKEPETIGTAGTQTIKVRRKICIESIVFKTSAGPLRWRNLECLVHEEDQGEKLLIDRETMKQMGYSTDALLVAAKTNLEKESSDRDLDTVKFDAQKRDNPFIRSLAMQQEALSRADEEMESEGYEQVHYTPEVVVAKEQQKTVQDILKGKLEKAVEEGMTSKGVKGLQEILGQYEDVFRVEFSNDAPVKVPPMKVRIKEGCEPIMSRSRRYPPLHRDYMREHMEDLEQHGLVRRNPDSRWGSAPRIVTKKEAGQYRMTVDLRAVNDVTIPMSWPMPHLEVVMNNLEGSNCFFSLDCFRFYWQLPCEKTSCEYFTIVTPSGLYTPTRVIMGATDAVAFCQQAIERVLSPMLDKGVQAWLDDILGYANGEAKMLDILREVLGRCKDFGVKLHPDKCDFFQKETKWCGRLVSGAGVRHCPTRIQGLVNLQSPQTAGDLQQFLCAVNWMRASIPSYNELVRVLSDLVEDCMQKCGSRKKTKLSKVGLRENGWNDKHEEALKKVQDALIAMIPLAHPRDDADVCVFTDASQDYWGSVITQVKPGELKKTLQEQQHEPLAFLSGAFKGSSQRWAIVEK